MHGWIVRNNVHLETRKQKYYSNFKINLWSVDRTHRLKVFLMFPLQIHVTFDPAGSYAVEGLKPDTVYKFTLAARSEMGLGVFTQPIEAKTAQSSEYPILLSLSHQLT